MPELFILLIVVLLLVIAVRYFRSASWRGKVGEWEVRDVIGGTIIGKQYVLNNYTIEENGKSSQVDHIVINPRGIFVIETKNYSGDIYGDDNRREWTQVLQYGKVKNKLYNPVKQNATHVYKIKQIVGKVPVYSLVVFVQNNTQNIQSSTVIPLRHLRTYLHSGQDVLSPEQMEKLYQCILRNRSEISMEQHVQNIHKQQRELEQGICPRCGGKLVKRNGKYGDFFGCSNYPKCKFIKNI